MNNIEETHQSTAGNPGGKAPIEQPISRDEKAKKQKANPDRSAPDGALPDMTASVPEMTGERWHTKLAKDGDKYYFQSGDLAIVDKGRKLSTPTNDKEAITAMLDAAEERGWSGIKVSGAKEFKAAVWAEAQLRGMTVAGYKGETKLSTAISNVQRVVDGKPPLDRPAGGFAELVEHGSAPYKFEDGAKQNYYVKTRAADGAETVTWGKDLERAVNESGAQPGEKVTLKNLGKQEVQVDVPVKDEQGNVTGSKTINTHRNTWELTTAQQFAEKAAAHVNLSAEDRQRVADSVAGRIEGGKPDKGQAPTQKAPEKTKEPEMER